jgi:hypothetical protein
VVQAFVQLSGIAGITGTFASVEVGIAKEFTARALGSGIGFIERRDEEKAAHENAQDEKLSIKPQVENIRHKFSPKFGIRLIGQVGKCSMDPRSSKRDRCIKV